jgi:hypothetical protein
MMPPRSPLRVVRCPPKGPLRLRSGRASPAAPVELVGEGPFFWAGLFCWEGVCGYD